MTARVLHLIPTLGQGGAERQLSLLAPALVRAGQTIAVAFHKGGPNLQALEGTGVSLFRLPPRSNHDPRLILDVSAVVRYFQPDIIQTWLPQMDVLGGLVANCTGIKHILSERSSSEAYFHRNWKLKLREKLGKRAVAIAANSQKGVEYWENLGCKNEKKLIRNALTPISFDDSDDYFELKKGRLLLAACRLSREKNTETLISSLINAVKILPDHCAVIFGEGPERSKAEAMVAKSGVTDRVHLGGYTDSLYWWLHKADCFVSTSLFEGHPNTVLEAAASGCPLVVSDIPAHREFLGNDSAYFSAANDADGFTRALLETVFNPEESFARARRAKLIADKFTLNEAVRQYADLYKKIID